MKEYTKAPVASAHGNQGTFQKNGGFATAWRTLHIQLPPALLFELLVLARELPGYYVQYLLLLLAPAKVAQLGPVHGVPVLPPPLEFDVVAALQYTLAQQEVRPLLLHEGMGALITEAAHLEVMLRERHEILESSMLSGKDGCSLFIPRKVLNTAGVVHNERQRLRFEYNAVAWRLCCNDNATRCAPPPRGEIL